MELALTKGVKNSKKNAKIKKEGRGPYDKTRASSSMVFFFLPLFHTTNFKV
jgi:hypothetical protein